MPEDGNTDEDQPKQKKLKKSKVKFPSLGFMSIDATAITSVILSILTTPLILVSRFFTAISDGSTTLKDIYKLALQNCFIGLFISIMVEKPKISFASAVGSILFLTINYFINPSIEHTDVLTDTFKSLKRYTANNLAIKMASLIPIIKINQSFEDEFLINVNNKKRNIIKRDKRAEKENSKNSYDEVDEQEVTDDDIDDMIPEDDMNDTGDTADDLEPEETTPIPLQPKMHSELPPMNMNVPPLLGSIPPPPPPPIGINIPPNINKMPFINNPPPPPLDINMNSGIPSMNHTGNINTTREVGDWTPINLEGVSEDSEFL